MELGWNYQLPPARARVTVSGGYVNGVWGSAPAGSGAEPREKFLTVSMCFPIHFCRFLTLEKYTKRIAWDSWLL